MSLKRLTADERARLTELAVFPEDFGGPDPHCRAALAPDAGLDDSIPGRCSNGSPALAPARPRPSTAASCTSSTSSSPCPPRRSVYKPAPRRAGGCFAAPFAPPQWKTGRLERRNGWRAPSCCPTERICDASLRAYRHRAAGSVEPAGAGPLRPPSARSITAQGGTVGKTEYWGLRTLSYRVKKHRKGHYLHLNLDAPAAAITELERTQRIHEDVLRYLTVRVEAFEEGPSQVMVAKSSRDERGPRRDFDGPRRRPGSRSGPWRPPGPWRPDREPRF